MPQGRTLTLLSLLPPDVEEVRLDNPHADETSPVYYRIRAWNGEGVSAWSNVLRLPALQSSALDGWTAY